MNINLAALTVERIAGKNELQFRLGGFAAHGKRISISFPLSFEDFGRLMFSLQKVQLRHSIPIRPIPSPSGKVRLTVVENPKE